MSENTSQNHIVGNRVNTQKSTGPNTAMAKRRIRHNAIKHGFTTLGLLLRLQKNNKITGDLPNL